MIGLSRAGGLVRAASIFIALLLALGLPIALFASSVTSAFFDTELVSQTLEEHLIRSGDVRQLLAQELLPAGPGTEQRGQQSIQSWLAYLEPEDRAAIARILFPDAWITDQLHHNLERLYVWLDGPEPVPDLQIDLRPTKERLLAGGSLQLAEIVVASWPACTDGELLLLSMAAFGLSGQDLIACQPPAPLRALMMEFLVEGLRAEANQTPDLVGLGELFGDRASRQATAELKLAITRLRTLAMAAWLLPASGLGLILALSVRSWRGLLLWWGLPLLAGGVIGVLIALVAASALPDWISGIAQAAEPNPLIGPLQGALQELLESALGRYLLGMLLIGGMGLALTGSGWLIGRRRP